MGVFNFIETFFFISLGITFVLILLLVYHFKQRMSGLEQKCDAMFDIINNIVKELNTLRNSQQSSFCCQPANCLDKSMFNTFQGIYQNEKIIVSDDESEDSSDVGESGSEDEVVESGLCNYVEEEEDEEDDEDDEEDEDDIDNIIFDEQEECIRIIDIPGVSCSNSGDIVELDAAEISADTEVDNQDDESDQPNEFDESQQNEEENESIPPLLVEKLEADNVETNPIAKKDLSKEVYKKMTLSELKALVISKGLCSDSSRLKKNELLKLLDEDI